MKGITTPLLIVVVAVVLLVTAVVIIAIFSGGMQNIVNIINSWMGGQGGDACVVACNNWKTICTTPGATINTQTLPGCNKEGTCTCPTKPT